MESSDGSPPPSLCMIRAAELFPKQQMEKEDVQLSVPFQELAGESVKYLGRTDDGVLALSNYRMFLLKYSNNLETSVPLGLIESAQTRDLFHLIVNCKDASTVKCSFETAEQCTEWQRRIQLTVGVPETLESIFAFPFYSWTCDALNSANAPNNGCAAGYGGSSLPLYAAASDWAERLQRVSRYEDDFDREVERLGFDLKGSWRISLANENFKLCASYPQKILVPCCISDETLHNVANFRGSRRLPAVVWRHRKSGAIIARCSQPEVGWLGWRNTKDEQLLKALADACAFDRGEQLRRLLTQATSSNLGQTQMPSADSSPSSPDGSHEEVALDEVRKILIVDARSYTSAVTNRARGGGCECIEYYPCAEIEFMNLGNIHAIRKSFHALRQLCASPPDVPNWLGLLEKTMWLQHLSGLLAASITVCHAIEKKGRPVLVHCSDGWDRTPQIVATAQLCLDPFYRTVEGFRILVEREWLNYGHKFADRCGHGPGSDELNERCPVFLQWLDIVHQIHKQFPCSFEFSMGYLIKLAQHSHSGLFGTFLCNTLKERIENSVFERTFSVWPFLSGPMYRNPLYVPNKDKVLWPAHNVRDLSLWTEVYLGSLGNQNSSDFSASSSDGLHGSINSMAKTRSYGDLITAGIIQNGISRRSSDPNMSVEPSLTLSSNSENNSVGDLLSEREDSPDLLTNFIHDTTRKLQNLTIELNNHDDEDYKCFSSQSHQVRQKESSAAKGDQSSDTEANATNSSKCPTDAVLAKPQSNEVGWESGPPPPPSPQPITRSSPSSSLIEHEICSAFGAAEVVVPSNLNSDTCRDGGQSSNDGSTEDCSSEVTVDKTATADLDLALMQSVDLRESCGNGLPNGLGPVCGTDQQRNQSMWHDSTNTSTDTLVATDCRSQNGGDLLGVLDNGLQDVTDGLKSKAADADADADADDLTMVPAAHKSEEEQLRPKANSVGSTSGSTNINILPKVHSITVRSNALINNSSILSTVVTTTTCSLSSSNKLIDTNNKLIHNNNNSINYNSFGENDGSSTDNKAFAPTPPPLSTVSQTAETTASTTPTMEESIFILPEHKKLEISISGKCETIPPNTAVSGGSVLTAAPASTTSAFHIPYATNSSNNAMTRRRRTSSSNSRREASIAKQFHAGRLSRFSLPGVRSLPMTPPGLTERPQIALSCPDGLAHALSEQNIRLQQIVHEHKLREDVLLREIHDMRMVLLKKICPNCNNPAASNDDQCSALENVENASICSWEAVEDRSGSGPSSCTTTTSSSMQPNASSVLWVPDHAVSRCTSCQTEFWLGRRKHHCRSCGQIFCADCSEFWAPLPDEKLFSPVRLCGPCYQAVTTRVQSTGEFEDDVLTHLQQSAPKAAATSKA